jgi:hypothetical protein
MKLKTFEELEVRHTDQALVNNVNDILVELKDEGFNIEVGSCVIFGDGSVYVDKPFNLEKKGLIVEISYIESSDSQTPATKKFKYSEISEYILTVVDFMKEEWVDIEPIYSYYTNPYRQLVYKNHERIPKQDEDIQSFRLIIKKSKPTMLKRFLKKFETFSMNVDFCPRCGESTNGRTTMSVFNTEVICIPCKEKEKEDPDYQMAVDTEAAEVGKGNYNYTGIYPNYKPLY